MIMCYQNSAGGDKGNVAQYIHLDSLTRKDTRLRKPACKLSLVFEKIGSGICPVFVTNSPLNWVLGADGETRTLTMLPPGDFESPASTIPPHRPWRMSYCAVMAASIGFYD